MLSCLLYRIIWTSRNTYQRNHGPSRHGLVHGCILQDKVYDWGSRASASHLESLCLRGRDHHLHFGRCYRRNTIAQQPLTNWSHRNPLTFLSDWSLREHDVRSVYLDQCLHAQAQTAGVRAKMERGRCLDVRRTQRSSWHSLYPDPGLLRLSPDKIQIYKHLQHGRVRLPNPDDKRPNLQLGDKETRSLQQKWDQGSTF